jgi:hypothetical protein
MSKNEAFRGLIADANQCEIQVDTNPARTQRPDVNYLLILAHTASLSDFPRPEEELTFLSVCKKIDKGAE